jgi:hypothetical protein
LILLFLQEFLFKSLKFLELIKSHLLMRAFFSNKG